jgi:integrase
MILITLRHGLRASEVVDLRWEQVDFKGAILHVRRVRHGTHSTHPLGGSEMRALRRLQWIVIAGVRKSAKNRRTHLQQIQAPDAPVRALFIG